MNADNHCGRKGCPNGLGQGNRYRILGPISWTAFHPVHAGGVGCRRVSAALVGKSQRLIYSWRSLSTSSVPDPARTTWLIWIHWMLPIALWHWWYNDSTLQMRKLKDKLFKYLTQGHWAHKCHSQELNPHNLIRQPGLLTTTLCC